MGHLETTAFSPNTPKHSGSLGVPKLSAWQSPIHHEKGIWMGGGEETGLLAGATDPNGRVLPPPLALAPSVGEILGSASCLRDILCGFHIAFRQ